MAPDGHQLVQQTQKKDLEAFGCIHVEGLVVALAPQLLEQHFGIQLQPWEKTLLSVADNVILETEDSQKRLLSEKRSD